MNRAIKRFCLAIVIVLLSFGFFIPSRVWGQETTDNRAEARELNRVAIRKAKEKQFDEALELLTRAANLDPACAEAHLNIGTVHHLAGRSQSAIEHLKHGLRLDPRSHMGYNQLGVVYEKLRKPELAIDAFNRSIELKPDYSLAHFNLGATYAWIDRLKEAERSLEKALALDPANIEIKLYLASVYARRKRFPEALAQVKPIVREDPRHERANLILCRIYLLANDRQSALDMYHSFKTTNTPVAEQMFQWIFSGQVLTLPKERP